MRLFVALLPLLALGSALPNPQVSGDDVFGGGDNNARYGQDSGAVNDDLIDELFGGQNNGHSNGRDDSGNYQNDNYESPNAATTNYKPTQNQVVKNDGEKCSSYASQGYKCVPFRLCDEFGEIIKDGASLIDVRGNFLEIYPENSKCEGDFEVCCRNPDYTADVTTTTTTPKPVPYKSRCGTHNQNGIGVRIQNDRYKATTQFGEWPHMCAILEDKDDKNLYVCGGSLIAPDVVLTAAHCVDKYRNSKLKVRCGEWDTQQTVEPVPHQDRYVEHIDVHPGYSSRNLSHDMALLHTEEPFILSAHVDIMCLPNDYDDFAYDGCRATGWGKDRFASGDYQVILKQVELNLKSKQQCQNDLRRTRLGEDFMLDDSFTCAGGDYDVDTCKGDGGGPLVCPIKDQYGSATNRYMQAGIVAWGIGCGEQNVPGVYADVVADLCFIDWATRCHKGNDVDYYGMNRCNSWALDELNKIQKAIDAYNCQANNPNLDQRSREYKTLTRRARQHVIIRDRFKASLNRCLDPEQQQQDFSGYTRSGVSDYGNNFCNYNTNANQQNGNNNYDNNNANQQNGNNYDNNNANQQNSEPYSDNSNSNGGYSAGVRSVATEDDAETKVDEGQRR